MVSFSQIPSDTRVPGAYIEIDSSQAQRGLPGMPHKAIAIGQRLAAGQVAALVPMLVTNVEDAATSFGRGSMLHAQAVAFLTANDATEFWAIALDDDGAGTKAVKSVTFSKTDGSADFGSGVVNLWVGGRRVRVAVSADTTPAEIVTALVAAATDPTIPAVLTADGGTPEKLLVTAKHAGATGNNIDVRINYYDDERSPDNLTAVIATDTAGAGDPEIDTALAAIDGDWWTEVICPYLDGANYTALSDFLVDRFDARDMRDGLGIAARGVETFAAAHTWGNSVNSPHVSTIRVPGSPTPPWEIGASFAGIVAFQTQIDPARQLRTLELAGVLPGKPEARDTRPERELLLKAGISTVDYTPGVVRIERAITNYQISDAGADDTAYLDLVTLTALAYLRWSEAQRILLRFPRHKLANDGTGVDPGQAVATPDVVRGELVALYREWERAGLVENADFYIERLIVERAGGDPNRLNSLQTPDIINNFRVFAALIQFRL